MAPLHRPEHHWNEFRWEREIRRDERRISCYYRELPACLDLPGEEEMIFNSLYSQPDLVPASGGADTLRQWPPPFDDDEEEEFIEDARRPGSEIVTSIDRLAAEWNIVIASILRADLLLPGLGVACAYAKLLARAVDFVETDPETPGLKITLAKRAAADLNELVGALTRIGEAQPSLRPSTKLYTELLAHLREQVLDQLAQLRS